MTFSWGDGSGSAKQRMNGAGGKTGGFSVMTLDGCSGVGAGRSKRTRRGPKA